MEAARESRGVLNGIKVLDFMWWGAGAFGTKVIADMGAEVIKVESRTHPDIMRVHEPQIGGISLDRSGMYSTANTSKLSLMINSSHPKGLDILKRLVRWADIVTNNYSPGTMDRMGLGYDVLKAIKPSIIFLDSSSFGKAGVYKNRRGAAHTGNALSGHWYTTGYPDGDPQHSNGIGWADLVQPMFSIVILLAAIDYRRRTGKGQYIDTTQIETMNHMVGPLVLDYNINEREAERIGARHIYASPHGAFRCKGEDRWCAIGVFTEADWASLCKAMGKPSLAQDPRFATRLKRKENEGELEKIISQWTANQDAYAVMDALQKAGVVAGVVQSVGDVVDRDPQVKARNLFPRLRHPLLGETNHPISPHKFNKTPVRIKTPALIGEHNPYVLKGILGMNDDEVKQLTAEGVLE